MRVKKGAERNLVHSQQMAVAQELRPVYNSIGNYDSKSFTHYLNPTSISYSSN